MSKKSTLEQVLPENLAAQSTAAQQTISKIPYTSTTDVATNQVFDAAQYDSAYKAAAAAQSEHLNFAGRIAQLREPLSQLKHDFSETATQLREIKHIDTRVNIVRDKAVYKIDIPGELKAYANGLDQTTYLQIMLTFLGEKRLGEIREYVIRGGQIDKPALWLNQQLYVETKMPYAYTIDREITPELVKECQAKIAKIEEKQEGLCQQAFRHAFGEELYTAVNQIANVAKLHIYIVVVMLADKIIELHTALAAPPASVNLWQSVLGSK
jgi:hypothetical protein